MDPWFKKVGRRYKRTPLVLGEEEAARHYMRHMQSYLLRSSVDAYFRGGKHLMVRLTTPHGHVVEHSVVKLLELKLQANTQGEEPIESVRWLLLNILALIAVFQNYAAAADIYNEITTQGLTSSPEEPKYDHQVHRRGDDGPGSERPRRRARVVRRGGARKRGRARATR